MAKDDIDLAGVTPITPESFNNDAVNPYRNQPVTLPQVDITADSPDNINPYRGMAQSVTLPPQEINTPTPPLASGPISPQQANALRVATQGDRIGITKSEAQNQADLANTVAGIHGDSAEEQARRLAEREAVNNMAFTAANQHYKELSEAATKLATEKIDPERYWNKKSTEGKVLSSIGMFLGGASAATTGGRNPALEQLNKAVEQDIDSQKDHIANSWKALDERHKLANDELLNAHHDDIFKTSATLAYMKIAETRLAAATAKSQSITAQNNGAAGVAAIQDNITALRERLAQQMAAAGAASQAKMEKLAAERRAARATLLGKENADPVAIDKALDKDYSMLRNTPYASAGQQAEVANESLAKQTAIKMYKESNGAVPLDRAFQLSLEQISKQRPPYETAYGVPVGAGANGAALNVPQKLVEERRQVESDLKELQDYKNKVNTISTSLVEPLDPTTRGVVKSEQERYRAYVYRQVAKMYKLDTTAQEPKNVALIEHFAAPYLPRSIYEPIDVTKHRMDILGHDMQAGAVGITGQQAPPDVGVGGKPAAAPQAGAPAADPFTPTAPRPGARY